MAEAKKEASEPKDTRFEQLEERVSKIESKIWGFPQKTKEKK